ncbi:MAG: serine/threonine-protein kinase [Myxococcota bacterium]
MALPPLSVDARIGPFVLVDEIGTGESSRVYRAHYRPEEGERHDVGLPYGESVVLKVLREDLDHSLERLNAFTREAELLVMLDHPGLTRPVTRGTTGSRVWLALEYIEGESFSALLDAFTHARLRMKPQVVLTLMADLCDVVASIHGLADLRGRSLGLVHRNLSPRSVLLDIRGRPRVIDFSCAFLSARDRASDVVVGTPGYLPPEQARLEPVGPSADVYALGLLMFELLTSQRAYPVESLPASLMLQTHGRGARLGWPDHIEISGRLRAIVDQALHEDPSMRPPDARALQQLLVPLVKDEERSRHALRVVARDLVNSVPPPPVTAEHAFL